MNCSPGTGDPGRNSNESVSFGARNSTVELMVPRPRAYAFGSDWEQLWGIVAMDREFWKVRRCMLEPIPEIFDAAALLGAAADFHADGRENDARDALRAADLPEILDWCERLWGSRGNLDA